MTAQGLSVKIGSMVYHLTAKEDPEYTREIARKADELLRSVKGANPGMGDQPAAILALVNSLDACEKLKGRGGAREEEIEALRLALDESKALCLRMREQAWELKKDLLYYRNLCEIYEERMSELPQKGSPPPKKVKMDKKRPLDRMQRSMDDLPASLSPEKGDENAF